MSKTSKPQAGCKIAVIGLGCVYPGAVSPLQLWENILSRRRQFREMPDVRLPNKEYFDPDPSIPNKTYQNKAAVIDGYSFNWLEKRIPKQTFESTDIVHWLALDTALQAIHDAGFTRNNIPVEKTGVILGNTLTGEFTRSNQMLLRWPFVRKVLRESARKKGLIAPAMEIENVMEQLYKSVFSPVTEDTLAGGLANTIAGRICNYLDLHGGGYIVDGACSSSLLALVTAANYLELHQMDMAIVGGIDISLDTFELVGFAKTSALTPDEMRVYDKNGKGFLPGEGCGMVILKRLEDAIRDQNAIYAVVDGWGISSDGKGGITAPSVAGQSRALIRAREKSGISPEKLDFIEGHGTGTTVGDKVELEAISIALNSQGEIPSRNCGVTSFKSIVGHTKAAAGIGAFIKSVMAVNRRVLPPTAGLKDPNPIFDDKALSLYPITRGNVKDPGSFLYAGVSAMGFGGINSHVILHSAGKPSDKLKSGVDERHLIASYQTHELFLFAASDTADLKEQLNKAAKNVAGISYAEMTDLACSQNTSADHNASLRAAIIADTPFELQRKIALLIDKLNNWDGSGTIQIENSTVSAGYKKDDLKIGAVFPGQGSQKINMARRLAERYQWAQSTISNAGEQFLKEESGDVIKSVFRDTERAGGKDQLAEWQTELKQTNVAQPAITLASLLWFEYLTRLGIRFCSFSGHSLGELMAFYAAGQLSTESLLRFSAFRGKSMAKNGSGTMASLQCGAVDAEKYFGKVKGYVTIANINGPQQTVISGETETIRHIVQLAKDDQIGAVELPVSAAFHSKLIAEVARDIAGYEVLKVKKMPDPGVKLISSVNGCEVSGDTDLNNYFAEQAVSRVDFISTVRAMKENCDVILEVGPGRVLTGLISNIAGDVRVFPVEPVAEDDLSFNVMIGNIYVAGCNIRTEELYKSRLVRTFTPAREKNFLVNPLERPFPEIAVSRSAQIPSVNELLNMNSGSEFNTYVRERSAFIREIIDTDFKYFRKYQPEGFTREYDQLKPSAENPVIETAEAAKAPVSNNNVNGVSESLYRKIHEMTGFDEQSFNNQMRLLDDFNLDSIKATTLINGLAKMLGVAGKINASVFSNATLAEITDGFQKILGPGVSNIQQSPESTDVVHTSPDIANEVYGELSKRTGFPREALSGDHKLLDDLNMDSIKAGAFISQLLKKFNIQKKSSQSVLSNASISDIIKVITESAKPVETNSGTEELFATSWVNAYSVELSEEPFIIEDHQFNDYWKDKSLVIVYHEDHAKQASELKDRINQAAARVIAIEGSSLNLLTSFENCCILVLLPNVKTADEGLRKTVKLLSDVASRLDEMSMLGFLQFNDGLFLRQLTTDNIGITCAGAVSFAASLHLERPDLKIRVVEAHRNIPLEKGTKLIMQEFIGPASFDAAGYDLSGIRRKMQYRVQKHLQRNEIKDSLNDNDVVIATGGGRGITAECMFAMAMKFRCKSALIGSSVMSKETESLLARYKAENLPVRYYTCDISNLSALQATIRSISNDLGSITAVLHGAGRNIPRRAEKVSYEDALDEIAPKLEGFFNLTAALKDNEIRYFIALTSIIGITGMPGNSWYAFSNENLDQHIRILGRNSKTITRTIAYSIWDEIGMGARMGSNRVLSDMGIGSIKPSAGIEAFMYWLTHENDDQQIVVSSRMGGLDTWKPAKPAITANRFITDIRSYEPGRDLSARVKLSSSADLYLEDHNYQGSLLFPTVYGLEAMAQAACLLAGISDPDSMTIENISLRRPVVVPPEGDIEIGLSARVMEKDQDSADVMRIFAGIATEDSDYAVFHFSAEFIIRLQPEKVVQPVVLPEVSLNISAETDLYSWLLFQGPRFRHISRIFKLDNDQAVFTIEKPVNEPSIVSFSAEVRAPMIAGNPLLRDVLLQSVQLYLTKKKYLPVSIKRWELFDIGNQCNGGIVISRLNILKQDSAVCDVEYISDNHVIERISGYEVKALESTADYPDAVSLSDLTTLFAEAMNREYARYEQLLDQKLFFKLYKHNIEFNKLDVQTRHEIEQDVFQSLIHDMPGIEGPCRIVWEASGKPSIDNNGLNLSLSHSQTLLLMTLGTGEQGCDIEFVNKRSRNEWDDLLENKFSAVLKQLVEIDGSIDIACTRIWCVKESLIKSFGQIPLNISIEKVSKKGIIFRALNTHGDHKLILTFPVEFLPSNTAIMAMVVSLKKEKDSDEIIKPETRTQSSAVYNKDTRQFSDVFFTTFRDCRGFSGKTHFTTFIDWMGGLRELVLAPIGKELLKDLGTGEFGMVTNTSDIHVRHEAGTLDEITGNIWITGQSDLRNSLIDLNFAFYKNQDDKKLLLADCKLSTTWVRIEGRGVVKKAPIPGYFMDFLNDHIQLSGNMKTHFIRNGFPINDDIGEIVYRDKNQLRPECLIHENIYSTGLTHGNTVGNLYYSNYYTWQSRMIEEYLYAHVPEIMTGGGKAGEFITIHSGVNHLQEAMPFESIAVTMYIPEYYKNGFKFYFEYHSVNGTTKRKLAYGTNTVVFCSRQNENVYPVVHALPEDLVISVMNKIHNSI